VGCSLGVEVHLGGPAQHQRKHDLGEQHGLEVGLGFDRLSNPGLKLGRAQVGDGVALPVGPGLRARLDRMESRCPHGARLPACNAACNLRGYLRASLPTALPPLTRPPPPRGRYRPRSFAYRSAGWEHPPTPGATLR
jgi:hypothetical protein